MTIVQQTRIFLETKGVDYSLWTAGHMYLVRRTVSVDSDTGAIVDNSYHRDADLVIRGSSGFTSLSIVSDLLDNTEDRYGEFETRPETPADRHSTDITDLLGGVGSVTSAWEQLKEARARSRARSPDFSTGIRGSSDL